jgi:hypothetical protein
MQLRYSANLIPAADSMQKIAAVCWAPNGKKFAVAAADRVKLIFDLGCPHFWLVRSKKRQVPDKSVGEATEVLRY